MCCSPFLGLAFRGNWYETMKRFLFYDIETSGLSPAFDQVLTFAGIQTDTDLNELSREEITVRLRPDVVPSPGAFLTHGLTPDMLDAGLPEYQAALKIHALLNTPDTISVGYNSLGFDDEFLRFMFYRNLLDPYSHQYANGCSRMDLLPVTVIYRLFCEHVLSWPRLENGRSTLKLEHLSRENRFDVSGKAHEAMADVEALLSLARLFFREKDIWNYVLGFFDKKTDLKRVQDLNKTNSVQDTTFELGLMVSVSFGAELNYIAPVVHLGQSIPYKNQSLWVRLDKPELLDTVDQTLGIYDFFVTRKRPGDQLFVLPCLDRFWARLTPEAMAACQQNLDILKKDDTLFLKTAAFHRSYKYPDVPDIDPDADLYQGGFFSWDEKREIALFHGADSDKKSQICDTFGNVRVRALARRILVRSFGSSPIENAEFTVHLKGLTGEATQLPVKGYRNDVKFTCAQAVAELDKIESTGLETLDEEQRLMVVWLKSHVNQLLSFLAEPF